MRLWNHEYNVLKNGKKGDMILVLFNKERILCVYACLHKQKKKLLVNWSVGMVSDGDVYTSFI